MASAGTLLSDLDSKSPVTQHSDDDLVNRILADMNMPSSSNPVMSAPPPPSGQGARVISAPNPNSTYSMASDPAAATAHLIGKDYPSTADFANLMHAPSYTHGNAYAPYATMSPPPPTLMEMTRGNVYSELFSQLKQPILVAIIVFLVSLPFLNVLIGHYLPSLIQMNGDVTTVGLALKSAMGGALFWILQKVVAPLLA